MKHLKYLAGTSLLSLACIGLFVACGDTEGESCLLDTDCVAPDVCEAEVCTATCTADSDCLVGEVCGARQNGDGTVCVPDNDPANNPTSCADETDPNAFCEAQAGANAFCDTTTGECVGGANNVPNSYYVIQVADTTTVPEACGDVNDPGSDIQGIELLDSGGNSLGWGNLVAEAVDLEGNDEANYEVIGGTAPALDGDGCVDTFSGNVLALGCGGWVAVEFLDGSGAPVALENDQTIFVYEYGGVCSTGTTDDTWNAFLCTDTAAISDGNDASCATLLGDGSGVGSLTVTLP